VQWLHIVGFCTTIHQISLQSQNVLLVCQFSGHYFEHFVWYGRDNNFFLNLWFWMFMRVTYGRHFCHNSMTIISIIFSNHKRDSYSIFTRILKWFHQVVYPVCMATNYTCEWVLIQRRQRKVSKEKGNSNT